MKERKSERKRLVVFVLTTKHSSQITIETHRNTNNSVLPQGRGRTSNVLPGREGLEHQTKTLNQFLWWFYYRYVKNMIFKDVVYIVLY
jgi:hypothetical protein